MTTDTQVKGTDKDKEEQGWWLDEDKHAKTKHSLIGLPLGTVVDADELLHPPVASGHFASSETSYFGFSIPEHRLNCEIYLWYHPALKVMSASVLIWTGFKKTSLAAEYVNHHHFLPYPKNDGGDLHFEALNLHVRVIDPFKSVQIDFEDRAQNVKFSYRQDAIMPPGVRPGGYHFTQAVKTQGELNLRGTQYKIDGFFSRDRSWTQERREDPIVMPPLTWMVGVFDSGFAFHCLAMDDMALKPSWASAFPSMQPNAGLFWGYVWKDGELAPVSMARKLTTYDADGISPRHIEMDMADAKGRHFTLRGEVQARLPWQTWQNMNTIFCQTRWECDGKVGFGDSQDVQFQEFPRLFAR
ncbi:hypothetical protein G7048_26280 (plasmid) [Diaphorobacter sp. HDW4B]|uniref:DUF7064 domain-containing protein n=1 Tax=Diaphorobacter sp. HDW4B TaxID=2714925 RepID=UPI00140E177B|nr:hypothetical protein [Diaphorobacter sp. HDW4B]QIL74000.1 hypothetical protein G7048_26280 [Diaphorobacter sp. HDW4B]